MSDYDDGYNEGVAVSEDMFCADPDCMICAKRRIRLLNRRIEELQKGHAECIEEWKKAEEQIKELKALK